MARYPVPRVDTMNSVGSGECITYKMSPEEYEQRYGQPMPIMTNRDGEPVKKPSVIWGTKKPQPAKRTKEEYLQLRVSGTSRVEVAKMWGMQLKSLESNWLRDWDIKAIGKEEMAMYKFMKAHRT